MNINILESDKFGTSNVSPKIATTYDYRCQLSSSIRYKFPDRIPVILESKNINVINLKRNKYLVPESITVAEFIINIRKYCSQTLQSHESIFMFFGDSNTIPNSSITMLDAFNLYKHDDGFLYIKVDVEKIFGVGCY